MRCSITSWTFVSTMLISTTTGALRKIINIGHRLILFSLLLLMVEFCFIFIVLITGELYIAVA